MATARIVTCIRFCHLHLSLSRVAVEYQAFQYFSSDVEHLHPPAAQ